MDAYRKVMERLSVAASVAMFSVLFVNPAQSTGFFVGGAWGAMDDNGMVPTEVFGATGRESAELPVSFTAGIDVVTDTDLTIGQPLPVFSLVTLDVDGGHQYWGGAATRHSQWMSGDSASGSYVTSFMSGHLGVFGGVKDRKSAFSMGLTTSRTVGASLGYAGFYLQGAYQDAGPDGLLDGRRAWQAGLGYGSGDFDFRLTYVESAFVQGSPTELEGKQWMIGGLMQVTPSILLNANAFIVDRELTMPTVEPPGTGARVGLQLRF